MWRCFFRTAYFLAMLGIFSAADAAAIDLDLDLGLRGSYRVDKLAWSVAGNVIGTSPNVISELTWRDLEIYPVGATANILAERPGAAQFAYGRGRLDYGWINDGENRDADFSGDNRTREWSRSISDAGDGNVYDLSIGGGPGFRLLAGRLTVIPLLGYSYHRQNLTMQNGIQTLSDRSNAPAGSVPMPIGPFVGLDSAYEAEWRGPWAGIDLHWQPLQRLTLSGGSEFHWADYHADARWNLRPDLAQPVSFSHAADGKGVLVSLGLDFEVTTAWLLGFEARYQHWETGHGRDRLFFANGGTFATRLNEVTWESAAWMVEVRHRFF
jgi:hypothetical protein